MKISYNKVAQLSWRKVLAGAVIALGLTSCTEDPDSPGIEFMPDMYRSTGYEAYLKKFDNDSAEFFDRQFEKMGIEIDAIEDSTEKKNLISDVQALYDVFNQGIVTRKPVDGSVAEGKKPFLASASDRSSARGVKMPLEYNAQNLKEGKAYYEIFCDHCHGEKGDGNGPMVSKGVYPVPPPSYSGAAAKGLSAGEIYHTIYFGKGMMGSHASQISEDKRWKIVMYVQTLQGNKLEDLAGAPAVEMAVDTVAADTTGGN